MTYTIDERARDWFTERFWADDELLRKARERFESAGGPLIEVPNETGAMLAMLVRASGARRILEIGTLFGYSAVWMARALPADGTVDTLELMDANAVLAEQLIREAGLDDLVRVHRGAALDTLATLTGLYDIAFIDADKETYPQYLEQLLRLVRSGGLIIADNVSWSGRVADESEQDDDVVALRSYLELARTHPRLQTNVLPVGDGVAVSVVA